MATWGLRCQKVGIAPQKTVGPGAWPILKGYFLVTGRVDRKGERAFLYKRLRALA